MGEEEGSNGGGKGSYCKHARVSSITSYLAAFTQPSDEQLAQMDRLIWAAVWGKDVEAAQGLRGGWLSVEASQLSPKEGGLGLILPSNMIRSRQIAMLHRAMMFKSATWTIYLQDWLSEWGGVWAEGWDGVCIQPAQEALKKKIPWAQAIQQWRKLEWHAPIPESSWEARATPLWCHPSLPQAKAARASKGGKALAAAGVRKLEDIWDASNRAWRVPKVVVAAKVPRVEGARAAAETTVALIQTEVLQWLGADFDSLLLNPPMRPAARSFWWDRVTGTGGQVVSVGRCKHADEGFGGFDVTFVPQQRGEWVADTEEERILAQAGELQLRWNSARRREGCGYEGSPMSQHLQDHSRRPRPIITEQTALEGVVVSPPPLLTPSSRCPVFELAAPPTRLVRWPTSALGPSGSLATSPWHTPVPDP